MNRAKVAILRTLRTTPRSVLHDYHRLMNRANYKETICKNIETAKTIQSS